jgi:hypothetical protein
MENLPETIEIILTLATHPVVKGAVVIFIIYSGFRALLDEDTISLQIAGGVLVSFAGIGIIEVMLGYEQQETQEFGLMSTIYMFLLASAFIAISIFLRRSIIRARAGYAPNEPDVESQEDTGNLQRNNSADVTGVIDLEPIPVNPPTGRKIIVD